MSITARRFVPTRWWVHAFLLIAICALMARYFFFVADHTAPPWYHMADADAPYTAQTLLFLNDGDGYYLQHPGATIYFFNSIAIRLLAPFSEAARGLLHLSAVTSQQDVERLLTTAVSVGRIVALLIVMALAGVLYWLIFSLTRNRFIAFIFTLFIATSQSTLFHYGWIRPESPSLLFFYLAVLLCVSGLFKKPFSLQLFWSMMLLTGLSLGMAVFAKVQIAPLIASLFAGLFILLWIPSGSFRLDNIQPRSIITNLIASALALVIAPYWALSKPAFLTADLVRTMYPDDQRLYGSLPQDFRLPFFVILVVLFGLAVTLVVLRPRLNSRVLAKLFLTSVFLNQITLGFIAAVYLVLLPASVSLDGYLNNTNHLIYTTLTNITQGGFAVHASVAFTDRLAAVSGYNYLWSSVANINLLSIVGCVTLLCLVKLIAKIRFRGEYAIPLWLFATGFIMDYVSTFRFPFPYSPYGIYSVGFYGLGLAYVAGLEIRSMHRELRLKSIFRALPGLILVALVILQGGMKVLFIIDSPRGAASPPGYSREDAWRMIKVITPQFLRLTDYAVMAQATCVSQVDSPRHNAYGFPGGWRGWLQAIGESRRDGPAPVAREGDLQCYLPLPPARRLPDGACRANQNINNWWLLGFDINESHVASDQRAELKMHWLPPFDVKPVSGEGFYQGGDNDWVQVVSQEGALVQWSGANVVKMQNLSQAAPPLAISGNRGEFSFSHEKVAGRDVIRVSPAEGSAGGSHRVIQFGPRVNDTEAGLTIRPGQVVFVSLWARLSGRPAPLWPAGLFIQDQTDVYQMTKTPIDGTAWQHYAVFREIREGATRIGIGMYWQPESEHESLAIRDWRVFVLDRCRQDRASARQKCGPPLRQ